MLLGLIETVGNQALEYGPQTKERLDKLQGRTMALEVKNINRTWYFTPTPAGIDLSDDADSEPDVVLKTTLNALIAIARDGMEDAELEPGELEIEGDAMVGQRFAAIIGNIDIDWEELVADKLGDSSARFLTLAGQQLSGIAALGREGISQIVRDLMEGESLTGEGLFGQRERYSRMKQHIDELEQQIRELEEKLDRPLSSSKEKS